MNHYTATDKDLLTLINHVFVVLIVKAENMYSVNDTLEEMKAPNITTNENHSS